MESLLAQFFMKRRLALGLTRGQLARLIGYKNISKGGGKIFGLETCGSDDAEFIGKVAAALGIDEATVDRLLAEDYRRYLEGWNKWADEPVKPHLVIRLFAAVYSGQDLPENITVLAEAEAWASARAKELKLRCCLVWSRRLSLFYAADGSVETRQEATPNYDPRPSMQIGKHKFLLAGTVSPPKQPEQP